MQAPQDLDRSDRRLPAHPAASRDPGDMDVNLPPEIKVTETQRTDIGFFGRRFLPECRVQDCDWHDQMDAISSGYQWAAEHVIWRHWPQTWYINCPNLPYKLSRL